jgi:hypothetical protein
VKNPAIGEAMIRWEQQDDGSWQGSSGDIVVATVTRDDDDDGERWLWTITALKRPKGWRKGAGHRTSWLEARGAADDYWNRWLAAAALRPDIETLAKASLKAERGPAKKPARKSVGRKRG